MKRTIFKLLIFSLSTICFSQNVKTFKLLPPDKIGGKPLMQALNERHSSRDFIDKSLTDNQLSGLLWAAYGLNRLDENKRTAPSAHDKQEIDVYVTMDSGAYVYDAVNHALIEITPTDIRSSTGSQAFIKTAALNLVYVLNKEKSSSKDEVEAIAWGSVTTGAIVQNIYLYCASENLGCVVRGWFDKNELAKSLKLSENQVILLTQTVGYCKD
jgi:SagB-type dehydrogenase family enzyme